MLSGPPTNDTPPTGQELGGTYGAMLISTIIAAALYGVSVLQALYYYDKFPEDHWAMKAAVAMIWALDTASIVLDSHAVYYYLIANYNNPSALLTEVWCVHTSVAPESLPDSPVFIKNCRSIQVEEIITFSAVLIAQIFFIQRIYQLRPYLWYIPMCQAIIAIASYALIIVIQIQIFQNNLWDAVPTPEFNDPIIANWLTGLIVDVSIAAVLCWYLWSEKSYIRKKTHRMINRIIIFSVNRGAFAAGTQLLTFVTKFVAPQEFVWLAFHNVLCKVYTNSMLATLNSRVALRSMMMDTEQDATEFTLPSNRPSRFSDKLQAPARTRNHQVTLQSLQFAPGRTSQIYPKSPDEDNEEFEPESDYVTVSDVDAVKASTSRM
ncbi:hypothetical protein C8Q73DRAFT_792152 [Cubamyces lactineus]|nr:hypothetical protein C8Q73DRAFT_792152 [Cubamyces lactineus]